MNRPPADFFKFVDLENASKLFVGFEEINSYETKSIEYSVKYLGNNYSLDILNVPSFKIVGQNI